MKNSIILILIIASCTALAQDVPFKPLRYDENYQYLSKDTSNDWYNKLKFQPLSKDKETYISYGGEVRYQYFWYQNEGWGAEPQDKDGFLLTRYLGNVDFHAGKYFRTFVQLQSSLANGEDTPSPVDQDILDLHQAFFDVSFPAGSDGGFTFRLGRQELAYGSQRLVSVREGPNNRQSFDAAKIMFGKKDFKLDAFYGNYVLAKPGIFDDMSNKNTALWGVYSTFNKVPILQNIDLYYFGIHREHITYDEGTGAETRHSIGTRWWYTSPAWLYDVEGVYQFGKFKTDDISAWTASINTAYTFTGAALKPQLGLKGELISGNKNYGSSTLNTFDPLFPKGAYFGLASLIGPSNLTDIHPYISFALTKKLSFTSDYDLFYRMSRNDGIYAVNSMLIYSGRNAQSKDIGKQLQNELEYNLNKFLYLRTDFTWFKAGEYLKEVGPGKDILMASTTIQFKF